MTAMTAECAFIQRGLGCPIARFSGERGNCATCSEKLAEDMVRSLKAPAVSGIVFPGSEKKAFSRLTGRPIK